MRRYRRPSRIKILLFRTVCVLISVLTVFLLLDARIRPMIKNIAVVQAQNYAAVSAGKSIPQILRQTGSDYESLVDIQRDTDGNIVSVQTDAMQLNLIKSAINSSVASALSELSAKQLGIPLGSLTGLALLNGRGPKINVIVSITGSAQTSLISTFDSAGVNQTRHRVYLKTVVTMLIVFPTATKSAAYTYEMLAAETIIVGKVPALYAGVTQK